MTTGEWLTGLALVGLTCLAGGMVAGIAIMLRQTPRRERQQARLLKRDLRAINSLVVTAQCTLDDEERCDALASVRRRLRGLLNEIEEELR